MDQDEISRANDAEWRKLLWKRLDKLDEKFDDFRVQMIERTTSNKIKVGFFTASFGFIGGAIVSIAAALIKTK